MSENYDLQKLPDRISPEVLTVCNTYLHTFDSDETARILNVPVEYVVQTLQKKEVKRYIDSIFLEQGYLNRFTMQHAITELIKGKFAEMEEAGLASNKDILELLQFAHKVRMDEEKLTIEREKIGELKSQTNIQVNQYGENYGHLMSKLLDIDGSKS